MTSLIFVFVSLLHKADRFHVALRLGSVTDHGRGKNVTRTPVPYSSTLYRFSVPLS